MLRKEDNEMLTQVGPGTLGGDFHRCYWQPVIPLDELSRNPVQRIKLLDEDLVVFRDASGKCGLIERHCPHRKAGMELGIPDESGLRCAYHGWLFNSSGLCLDRPLEPEGGKKAAKVCAKAYPVQEMGGMVWAYLGKGEAPLLPKWDLIAAKNCIKQIGIMHVQCSWLQYAENLHDLRHNEYLHGHFFKQVLQREGKFTEEVSGRSNREMNRKILKTHAIQHPNGIQVNIDRTPAPGQPLKTRINMINLFPYASRRGVQYGVRCDINWRVPIDDRSMRYVLFSAYFPSPGTSVPEQEVIPSFHVPRTNEAGEMLLDTIHHQDAVCMESQGEIVDRTTEILNTSDADIIVFRRLLKEQFEIVRKGGDPINVFRNKDQDKVIELEPPLGTFDKDFLKIEDTFAYDSLHTDRYGPLAKEAMDLVRVASAWAKNQKQSDAS